MVYALNSALHSKTFCSTRQFVWVVLTLLVGKTVTEKHVVEYKMLQVYIMVKGTEVDLLKQYNVVEYKMDKNMKLQVYNLVRGTEVDVLKQYDVVGYYVDWVELFLIYNLVRGTKEEATWVQDDVRHAGKVVDVEK